MGYSEVRTLNSGSGLLEIYIPSLNQNYIDSIRYMPGNLLTLQNTLGFHTLSKKVFFLLDFASMLILDT